MNMQNIQNINFTGRCPAIRDAQWVSHTVNTELPHISTTRLMPLYKKLAYSEPELVPESTKIFSMKKLLDVLCLIQDNAKNSLMTEKNLEMLKKVSGAIKTIKSVAYSRVKYQYDDPYNVVNILNMLEKTKRGNCYEDAKFAELILLLNGIQNACTATLEARFAGKLNHILCVFNRDGTRYNGVINKNTIVIDPWAQKVDFGNNMLKFYRNMCQENFDMPADKKLDITPISKIKLSEDELEIIKEKYPKLIFNSSKRKFMQN